MLKSSVLCGISMEEGGEVFVQGVFIIGQNGDESLPEGYYLKEVFMVERYHVGPKDPPQFGNSTWQPISMEHKSIFVVYKDDGLIPVRFSPWDYGMCGKKPHIGLQDFNPARVRETRNRASTFIREELGQLC